MKVSLKVIIAVLYLAVTLMVGAVSLIVTYSLSYDALRAIGENHAIAMANPILLKTEKYFNRTTDHMIRMRRIANDTSAYLPTREAVAGSWARTWTVPLRDILLDSNGSYAFTYIGFSDGSSAMAYYEPLFPGYVSLYALDGRTLVNCTSACACLRFKESYDTRNGAFTRITDPTHPVVAEYNETGTSVTTVYTRYLVATRGGTITTPQANTVAIYDTLSASKPTFGVPFNVPLHNSAGLLTGLLTVLVTIDQLNLFTQGIRGTANTQAFILDSGRFIVAASDPRASFASIQANVSAFRAVPLGCVSTSATQPRFTTNVTWGCRTLATAYSTFAPLQVAAATNLMTVSFITVGYLEASTSYGAYYVASVPINASLARFGFRLLVFLPEADVIGDIVTGRDLALIISASTFVVFVLITVAAVHVLLSPLHIIAIRMKAAASFQDDYEQGVLSWLKEVAEIEQTYYELNEQLLRIQPFIPKNVTALNDQDEEEKAAAEEHDRLTNRDDEDDEGSARPSESEGSISRRSTERSNNTRTSRSVSQAGAPAPSARAMLKTTSRGGLVAVSGRSARHIPVKQLNINVSLSNIRCSILAIDLKGFHERTRTISPEALVGVFKESMTLVFAAIDGQKGVLDVFEGDHIIVSFNAAKPCAAHARRATVCGLRIAEEIAVKGWSLPLCAGVSSGMASCGNVGTADAMRFNIIGPVVTQATLLRRLCRLYHSASVMVSAVVFPDLETQVNYSVVDIVRLPGAMKPTRIGRAVVELNRGDQADDEWMYLLQGNDSEIRNKAFEDMANGDLGPARDYVQKFDRTKADNAEGLSIVTTIESLLSAPSDALRYTDFGAFYGTHFAPPP